MNHTKNNLFTLRLCGALLAISLLLAACTAPTTAVPTATKPAAPPPTAVPTAAPTPAPTAAQAALVNVSGVAQGFTTQKAAAVPAGANAAWWEGSPQHTLLSLTGYPVGAHVKAPQIYIYPAGELAKANPAAGQAAADLQKLLQDKQAGKELPCLPLSADKQVLRAGVKFLDFKNGKGVRFLTFYTNGIVPVNNRELFYTFQGLTGDGKYYVAAVLPVTLQGLPTDANDKTRLPTDFPANYTKYLADTISLLEQNPAAAYTPGLDKLDALVQTIEIK